MSQAIRVIADYVNAQQTAFSWGDATPASLFVIPANRLITKVELFIEQAFDGSNPSLKVGHAGDDDELMAATDNDPTTVAGYETHPSLAYGTAKTILLTITPGSGATQGSGVLIVTYSKE